MLNTPEAWAVFGELEKAYFEGKDADKLQPVEQPPVPLDLPAANNDELALLRKEIDALKKQLPAPKILNFAVVYVLLLSNGIVKIGYTSDLTERTNALKTQYKLDVLDYYSTGFMSRDDAARLEEQLKAAFADCSIGNEFFDVKFTDVVAKLSSLR